MGPDDEWIRDEAADPAGSEGRPDDGWPDGGWPDRGWPPGPDGAAGAAGGPGLPAGRGKPWGHGGTPGFSGRVATVVAVAAAVAGIAVGLYLVRATPTASAASGTTPSASAPTRLAPSVLPGLSGNGNGQLQMMLTGQVVAVSRTSVTIGGTGPTVTAAVTSATTITGSVRGIGGVKVGDEISAQISGTPSHLTATALQDPAGNSGTS